jgi:hypothetical protein
MYTVQVTGSSASTGTVQVSKYSKVRNLYQGGDVQPVTLSSGQTVKIQVAYSSLPGDVNGDGKVDCADLLIVQGSLGKHTGQTGFDVRADSNLDGVVDTQDLSFVAQRLPGGISCQTAVPAVASLAPAVSSGANQTFTVTYNAPGGYQPLDVVNVLINNFLGRSPSLLPGIFSIIQQPLHRPGQWRRNATFREGDGRNWNPQQQPMHGLACGVLSNRQR